MRRILLLVLIVVTIAGLAAGCGDDDDLVTAGDGPAGDTSDIEGRADADPDAPLGSGPYPIADLTVSYRHPDDGISLTYRIACLGDTATITGDDAGVDAADACLALAEPAVQTRLVDGPPADQVCTEIYGGPDLALVTGTLDDQPVDAAVDRTNGCGISDWDDLLGAVLPAPIGVTG